MRTVGLLLDDTGKNAGDLFDIDKMKLDELKALADTAGIEYPANIKKSELTALLRQTMDEAVPY
ncbi:Rho termination factor, N-terminal domain [Ruminococcus sp. YE71]|uniref:hypothetical protein n=1 Tax=unclassified Ruminococcus TaxID=2608920 RepID=UPI0008846CBB|nr:MULTISPECIES: hypothetical protein [unclassified Ruminococcus]SDA20116.1 Rho termination factor, N-terminal domain [Ruminococcus sp. YE78]SFW31846.1 Rho termination factor, N-terminal domain [Ruminococcus sp. YE71]